MSTSNNTASLIFLVFLLVFSNCPAAGSHHRHQCLRVFYAVFFIPTNTSCGDSRLSTSTLIPDGLC